MGISNLNSLGRKQNYRFSYTHVLSYSGVTEVVGGFSSVKDGHSYVLLSSLVTAKRCFITVELTVMKHSKKRQVEKETGRHKGTDD